MLKTINFKNFKSWNTATIDCASITGFFGTNSSGKTSLLQFLLLLKQTKDSTDRAIPVTLEGDLISLGAITDVIHGHDTENTLTWNISMKLNSELVLTDETKATKYIIARSVELDVESGIGIRDQKPVSLGLRYNVDRHGFELRPSRQNTKSSEAFELIYHSPQKETSSSFHLDTFSNFTRHRGRAWPIPAPVKSYAFPDKVRAYFQNIEFLADLEIAYETQMDMIYYLGPLREFPARQYIGMGSRPSDVGKAGERTVDAILAATNDNETRRISQRSANMSFQEMVAYWLKKMRLVEDFRVVEIAPNTNLWQAQVKIDANSKEVPLPDVGFGVSQILPVITLLQYVPENSTVLLEQPELHLHPLAQAELADLFIQVARKRNLQIIFESHSEHLLLRLQRRVAENAIESSETNFYFCEKANKNSKLRRLEIDRYGMISNWPNKFMGDAFGETAVALEKGLKRMQNDDERYQRHRDKPK